MDRKQTEQKVVTEMFTRFEPATASHQRIGRDDRVINLTHVCYEPCDDDGNHDDESGDLVLA